MDWGQAKDAALWGLLSINILILGWFFKRIIENVERFSIWMSDATLTMKHIEGAIEHLERRIEKLEERIERLEHAQK